MRPRNSGDGRSDIFWRDQDGTITDWLGQADGGFLGNAAVAKQPLDLSLTVVGVGDFNGDHKADMLLEASDGSLQTWTDTAAWNDSTTGLAAAGLSFAQYFEIKHELGNSAINWTAVNPVTGNTYISDWAAKAAALHIH